MKSACEHNAKKAKCNICSPSLTAYQSITFPVYTLTGPWTPYAPSLPINSRITIYTHPTGPTRIKCVDGSKINTPLAPDAPHTPPVRGGGAPLLPIAPDAPRSYRAGSPPPPPTTLSHPIAGNVPDPKLVRFVHAALLACRRRRLLSWVRRITYRELRTVLIAIMSLQPLPFEIVATILCYAGLRSVIGLCRASKMWATSELQLIRARGRVRLRPTAEFDDIEDVLLMKMWRQDSIGLYLNALLYLCLLTNNHNNIPQDARSRIKDKDKKQSVKWLHATFQDTLIMLWARQKTFSRYKDAKMAYYKWFGYSFSDEDLDSDNERELFASF
ncbi:hypothetical protein M427DRAFT_44479 [Gonapodya prolifera JEL478]|uniref:F-box domain-containing protein n=1 Tax=Gonapodya prolifera (strain JEL478) TaxID=1344416 RepID=A0A139AG55_GONPJ|nr:hypothetical protein M427DRAFT_44479 [Gonapodya prolifera JEL478]|eukprot:KXS15393.1 hypothetical protein M427DRAFT_44479 [Gonapodya prolifera JEL478]